MPEKTIPAKQVKQAKGHDGTVYCLEAQWLDPDSKSNIAVTPWWKHGKFWKRRVNPATSEDSTILLASGSHDQTIILWEVKIPGDDVSWERIQVNQVHRLRGHVGDVYSVSFVAGDEFDSRRLISGGDTTIRIWDIHAAKQLMVLEGHSGYVSSVRGFGRKIFSTSWDTTLRSWDINKGRAMHVFSGHSNIVNCIDVTTTDLFSGSWDSTIIQWNRATGTPVHVYKGHTDGVQCLTVVDSFLISGSMDKTIRVWNTKNGRIVRIISGHTGGIECIDIHNNLCFSGSYDKTIRCHDYETGVCLAVLNGHTDGIYCIKIFNSLLFSGSGDRSIRVWDIRGLTQKKEKKWWERLLGR